MWLENRQTFARQICDVFPKIVLAALSEVKITQLEAIWAVRSIVQNYEFSIAVD
jgi:hypothetical protein